MILRMSDSQTENYEILRDAVARNSAAVLSLPSAGAVRHHKTRFLAEVEKGFWIEAAVADQALTDALILEKSSVGVAFKSGPNAVSFATTILARDENYQVNSEVIVGAVLLGFPRDFQRKQRRQSYRVALPPGHEVAMRLWRISEHTVLRDRPMPSLEIFAALDDLSVTGMRVICRPGRDGQPAKALPNERLRITLAWGGQELLTEGRVVHKRGMAGNQTLMGVQFKRLQKDLEGRQTQAKINELVGYLQREEVKRLRQAG